MTSEHGRRGTDTLPLHILMEPFQTRMETLEAQKPLS